MPVNKQQTKIFIYSVGHTGTHFLNDLIETSTPRDYILQPETYILKKLGVSAREKHTLKQFINFSTSFIPNTQINKAQLVIFWSHIYQPNSILLKDITKNKPFIPCISPMRDPLLRLNTNMFWNNKYNINNNSRLQYIKNSVQMFLELLSIPDEHRFLFPVDIQNIKPEKRKDYKDLFGFCSLSPTKRTTDFLEKWEPSHETKKHPAKSTKTSAKRILFETNKKAILEKDIDTLIQTMKLEFEYLQKQETLKRKLEQYGYRDLVWW